jgi:hypothetical protein
MIQSVHDRLVAHGRTRMTVLPAAGDGIVESRNVADVRPQSSVPHPLDVSLSWARSVSTTKSTARPLGGP